MQEALNRSSAYQGAKEGLWSVKLEQGQHASASQKGLVPQVLEPHYCEVITTAQLALHKLHMRPSRGVLLHSQNSKWHWSKTEGLIPRCIYLILDCSWGHRWEREAGKHFIVSCAFFVTVACRKNGNGYVELQGRLHIAPMWFPSHLFNMLTLNVLHAHFQAS